MSDLVGNPEDRFSHNEAHIQGVQRRMVLVVIFFDFFKSLFVCFVVLYLNWCGKLRLYMAYFITNAIYCIITY